MTAQWALLLEEMPGLASTLPTHRADRGGGHGLGTHRRVVPACHRFLTPDLNSEATAGRERGDQATFKQIHPGECVTGFTVEARHLWTARGREVTRQDKCSEEVPAAQLEGTVGLMLGDHPRWHLQV